MGRAEQSESTSIAATEQSLRAGNAALRSALRSERLRSEALIAALSDGYAELDHDGLVITANDALIAMMGCERHDSLAGCRCLIDRVERPDELLARVRDAARTGYSIYDTRLRRGDGTLAETRMTLAWLAHETRCLALLRDRSAQMATERALALSRDRFSKAFHLSPDAVNINRLADGVYLDINEGFTRIMGYTRDDVLGRKSTPDDLGVWVNGEDRAKLIAGLRAEGQVVGMEAPFRRKDGGITMGLMSARVVDIDGEMCILSITRDNSERHRARQELLAEKERLRVTLETIADGVVAADRDGCVVLLNPVAQRITGWSPAEAEGRPLDEVLSCLANADHPLPTLLSAGAEGRLVRLEQADAPPRLIEVRAARKAAEDGGGLVLVLRDVTDEQRLRQEVQRVDKLESLGVLAGGIAHDFNNLLTAIAGHAEFARRELATSLVSAQVHLGEVEQAAMRARGLTKQLLTFAKGGSPLREAVELAPLVRESLSLALSGAWCRGELTLAEDLWPVWADAGQLEQVLHNLVLNAAQAMPEGGTVSVSAANVDSLERAGLSVDGERCVRIDVADHGTGIAPEHLGRIFDPFYTTKADGNGLGLASVHSIVRQHGGQISVQSTLGAGTTFHIYLPAAATAHPNALPSQGEPQELQPWRILALEDEPAVARLLARMVRSFGCEVEIVSDGAQAVRAWVDAAESGRAFDCAVLDLTVPGGMGGREVVAELHRLGCQLLAVATSGYSTDPVMSDCESYGFSERLAKPYRRADVASVLARLQAGN